MQNHTAEPEQRWKRLRTNPSSRLDKESDVFSLLKGQSIAQFCLPVPCSPLVKNFLVISMSAAHGMSANSTGVRSLGEDGTASCELFGAFSFAPAELLASQS